MKVIDLKSLKETIKQNKERRVMLTFHSVGDTDSVSSAFALFKYFKNATISTPDFITSNSRRILERLGFNGNIITTNFDSKADLIILLDVNNFEDCGPFKTNLENFNGKILIIDHHSINQIKKGNVIVFNDESHNSAASIVYEIIKSMGINIDKNLANLILAGIISDSAEFKNSFPSTFIQVGELLKKSKTDYPSLLLELQHLAPVKNRFKFMKDLFSSEFLIKGERLILYGKAEFHANKVADDAIKIGADVALFYTVRKREISFSARLRPPLDRLNNIHLGKIMKDLAPIINGQGGGHPCAAGAYGPSTLNSKRFIDSFISEINSHAEN